jgi:predicted ATPase
LSAAAVIGSRFDTELLSSLDVEPFVEELITAELIDRVSVTPRAQYAFHHPLIRAVAYESQLKSDRAEWHRRLALAIQERDPDSVDERGADRRPSAGSRRPSCRLWLAHARQRVVDQP